MAAEFDGDSDLEIVDDEGANALLHEGGGGVYRLAGSTFLLTYTHCDGISAKTLETNVVNVFNFICADIVEKSIAREEPHADGGVHVHVGIKLKKRINRTIHCRDFDFVQVHDMEQKVYHPNIRGAKRGENWLHVMKYVTKLDAEEESASQKRARLVSGVNHTDGATYLADLRASEPMLFFKHHTQALAVAEFVDTEHGRVEPALPPMVFNRVPLAMQRWVSEVLLGPRCDRYRALMLVGGTRTGKTSWARRLLPPSEVAYMKGMWDAGAYHKKAKAWIVDDCDVDFPFGLLKTVVNGTEGTVTDKYRRKIRVHAMPCIWICNSLPDWYVKAVEYWEPNVELRMLTMPLWDPEEAPVIPPAPAIPSPPVVVDDSDDIWFLDE